MRYFLLLLVGACTPTATPAPLPTPSPAPLPTPSPAPTFTPVLPDPAPTFFTCASNVSQEECDRINREFAPH